MTLREIIYDLCKHAVRNSDYVAQNDMMSEQKLMGTKKERAMT